MASPHAAALSPDPAAASTATSLWTLRPESPRQPEVQGLLAALDAYQIPLSPPESFHGVDIDALCASEVQFWVLRDAHGRAQGCGAVWLGSIDGAFAGELKRVWVCPEFRGRGAGRALLQQLETQAHRAGATCLYAETGVRQIEAIALYERVGFKRGAPFGNYAPDPHSAFLRKALRVGP